MIFKDFDVNLTLFDIILWYKTLIYAIKQRNFT